jgi:hypothetical protein
MIRTTLVAALMFAQPFPGTGSTGGTAPVSPSVIATEMSAVDQNGRRTLELLILWRGTPGWHLKGTGGASGSGGSMGGSMGGNPGMVRSDWISQGGVNLAVRFDPAARKAWIQEKEIDLGDANVVLVDGVDSPVGPQVVRTLRIDPEYETAATRQMPFQMFIRRSPELVEFLQCGTVPPDLSVYEQKVFDMWCSLLKAP